MSHETIAERGAEPAEGVYHADGSLNETFLSENYGLGREEAEQWVEFGPHQNTVAAMLNDEECPVGDRAKEAYQEKGLQGVEEVFKGFSMADPRFSVAISEDTRDKEHEKVAARDQENKAPNDEPPEDPPAAAGRGENRPASRPPVAESRHGAEQARLEAVAHQQEEVIQAAVSVKVLVEESRVSRPVAETPEKPVRRRLKVASVAATKLVRSAVKSSVPEKRIAPVSESSKPVVVKVQSAVTETTRPVKQFKKPKLAPTVKPPKRVRPVTAPKPKVEAVTAHSVSDRVAEASSATLVEPTYEPGLYSGVDAEVISDPDEERPPEFVAEPATESADLPEFTPGDFAYKLEADLPVGEQGEVIAQVVEALRSPEAMVSAAVQEATAEVEDLARQVHANLEAGIDAAESEALLEEACVRLLEALDIDYDDKTVEKLTKAVLAAQRPEVSQQMIAAEESALELHQQGTHERKVAWLDVPALLARAGQGLTPLQRLGQTALIRAVTA